MSDGKAAVAAHEFGHYFAAHDAGLRTGGMFIRENDGGVWVANPDPGDRGQVAGSLVMEMAGEAAQRRFCRERGVRFRDGGSGDRASFRETARLPGSISMGEARRRADRVVDRNWSAISAQADRYSEGAER